METIHWGIALFLVCFLFISFKFIRFFFRPMFITCELNELNGEKIKNGKTNSQSKVIIDFKFFVSTLIGFN